MYGAIYGIYSIFRHMWCSVEGVSYINIATYRINLSKYFALLLF